MDSRMDAALTAIPGLPSLPGRPQVDYRRSPLGGTPLSFGPVRDEVSVANAAARLTPRKLLLVDDHELVRFGVRALHTEVGGVPIEWVEAGSLQEAIDLYGREGDVDAVLLDLNLPDCKGLQGLRQFLLKHPRARVAVFSATQDEFVVRQARALGAAGYVGKSTLLNQLRETLVTLLWPAGLPDSRGHLGVSGNAPAGLFPRFPSSAMFDRVAELGPRHLEILELVLSGCANQEICNATKLSLGTVKNYVSSLLLALDVTSRSHLISLFR